MRKFLSLGGCLIGALWMSACVGVDVDPNRRLLIEGQIQTAAPAEAAGLRVEYVVGYNDLPEVILNGPFFFGNELEAADPGAFREDDQFAVLGFDLLDGEGRFAMASLEAVGSRSIGVNLPGSPEYDPDYATLVFANYLYPLETDQINVPVTLLDRLADSRLEINRTVGLSDTLDVSLRYPSFVQGVYISGEPSSLDLTDSFRMLPGEASQVLEFRTRMGRPISLFFQSRNGGVIEQGTFILESDTNQIYRYEQN